MERFACKSIHLLNLLIGKEIEKSEIFNEYEDLTKMQGFTIGFVARRKALNLVTYQKDIEGEFKINRSTATGLLKQMEEEGYLYRETDPSDKRLKAIVLTEKALGLQAYFSKIVKEVDEVLLKDFNDEEQKLFRGLLIRGINNLENEKGRSF